MIFAGGRATRLGGVNKALLEVGDGRIIDRILGALRPLVDEYIIVSNDRTLESLPDVRLVIDPEPHGGVLPALAVGLSAASGALCLAVACDMPFVSRALFELMLDFQQRSDADVVIPRTAEYLEPMHAVYRTQPVLAAIRAALERGERRMISYFGAVRVRECEDDQWRAVVPDGRAFFNVNTPDDLAEARQLAALSSS